MVDGQDEGEQLGNEICLLPRWRADLQALPPVEVHAQGKLDDDAVAPAVRGHGMLIFPRDRETSPS